MAWWRRLWLLGGLLLPAVAWAQANCPPLFLQVGSPNTYYALVFVDPAAPQEQDRLMSQVTPLLNDIARSVSSRAGARRLQLELIACEHHIGSGDFAIEEMRNFLNFKVVAVFWKGQENGKPGLVQLAVPVYLRSDGAARRDVEVVTIYPAQSSHPVDSWIEVFVGQGRPLYSPFVAMGLATVYQRASDYKAAWTALCDSRIGLASLGQSTLRPSRERLDADIAAQLVALMKDLEQAARKAGIATLPPCAVPVAAAP